MPGRLGPRFALEAIFLILIAVGAGLAALSAGAIALVMSIAWLLVALLEFATERLYATLPTLRRGYYVPPPAAEPPAPAPPAPERVPVAPVQTDAATIVVSRPLPEQEAAAPESEPETPAAEKPEEEEPREHALPRALEPLLPRPRRRWFGLRGPAPRAEAAPEASAAPPRHVRLLAPGKSDGRAEEVGEIVEETVEEQKGRWTR